MLLKDMITSQKWITDRLLSDSAPVAEAVINVCNHHDI